MCGLKKRLPAVLGLIFAISLNSGAAKAEYRIGAGDILEIHVSRVQELQRRAMVGPDGRIVIPVLGALDVAGLTPTELLRRVRTELAARTLTQRLADGRDVEVVIAPEDVVASVVEYRPVYVNGDLAKPGEFPYRPNLIVRQAIALAGGVNILRINADPGAALNVADMRGEYGALSSELAKEQARVWRIKTELGEQTASDPLANAPLPKSAIAQIMQVERQRVEARNVDYRRQLEYLDKAIAQASQQIKVLNEQQKTEEEGLEADTEELKKMLSLYEKGSLPNLRVTDARRAVMLSSTRRLQTTAQLMEQARRQDELRRQKEKQADQWRIDLLAELQDANAKIAAINAKLDSVAIKVKAAGLRLPDNSQDDIQTEITIVRRSGDKSEKMVATEDTEVQPGDVVEVKVLRLRSLQTGEKLSSADAPKLDSENRVADRKSDAKP